MNDDVFDSSSRLKPANLVRSLTKGTCSFAKDRVQPLDLDFSGFDSIKAYLDSRAVHILVGIHS